MVLGRLFVLTCGSSSVVVMYINIKSTRRVMKKLLLLILVIFIFSNLNGKENIENKAVLEAEKMIKFYNSKDFVNYVDCILPIKYGNNPKNKEQFVKIMEMITKNDSDTMSISKLIKLTYINNQYQALFLNNFRNTNGYIIGILANKTDK